MDEVTQEFIAGNEAAMRLAVALLLGALIGIERGWVARGQRSGERIAGIRTHALVGLLGGIAALLADAVTEWAFPLLFLAVAGMAVVAYRARMPESHDFSITGLVGLLLTFCFGAIAVAIDLALAAACAVVTAVILDNKREIHGLLNQLQAHEMDAGLKLLLISVVMLPLLPDRGMGPGEVLNPYEIWWMVVLIASISFVGHFAMRLGGAEKGILFTSLFAGLSSSTALTLHFSRLSRQHGQLSPLLAAGILIACGTMFPRILIYCLVINPDLLPRLLLPVSVMGVLLYVPALVIWRAHRQDTKVDRPERHSNPLELRIALLFGVLLAVIMLLGQWLKEWLGEAGIYLLAATSGVADVDAITLSLTRMSHATIDLHTAVLGIVIAAAVNNVIKAGMAAAVGNPGLGRRVAVPMAGSLLVGLGLAWGL
ncbi:MgtC/SapB family protein [Halomonas nitroreducens]|uniref:MgtC/SapB family protein n=1 Tax=Halomonas nitroreducens TaxID=447425 RepID=A0A3S0HR58_9GAMM|nr:MgtC/SapB family protein [Halomonas nitroreducens]RTR01117.1 MgtC/SapB family protein [Halomonas nitroreducens]